MRPPAEATMAVRGGLAFTGNEPQTPAEDASRSDADEVPRHVHLVTALVGEGTSRSRGLTEDDERDDGRDRGDAAQRRPRQTHESKARRPVGKAPEHAHAVGLKLEAADKDRGADESKESPGELVIHKSGDGHEGEGDHADAEGPAVRVVELSCHEIRCGEEWSH